MDDKAVSKSFDCKTVAGIFLFCVFAYLTPIFVALGLYAASPNRDTVNIFLGIWCFGGIIVLSMVAGWLSKSGTILEPAAAFASTLFLGYAVRRLFLHTFSRNMHFSNSVFPMIPTMLVIFSLSVFGLWFGRYAQRVWKRHR